MIAALGTDIRLTVLAQLLRLTLIFQLTSGVAFAAIDLRAVGEPAEVKALATDGVGLLWLAGDQGICRFDGASWRCPDRRPALALTIDRYHGEMVWAALADGSIVAIEHPYLTEHNLTKVQGRVAALAANHEGLWIASSAGFFRMQKDGALTTLTRQAASGVYVDERGAVVASIGRSLISFDGDVRRVVAEVEAPITTVTFSRISGSALIGTEAGKVYRIVSLSTGPPTPLPVPSPMQSITALVEDSSRNVWIGNQGAVCRLSPAGGVERLTATQGLLNDHVNAIAADELGSVWVGTAGGLNEIQPNKLLSILNRGGGLGSNVAFSVDADVTGWLWAATAAGVSGKSNDDEVVNVRFPRELNQYDIRTVVAAGGGTAWAGGLESGLFSIVNGQAKRAWPAVGAAPVGVRALKARSKGGLWVGLASGGLGVFHNGKYSSQFGPTLLWRQQVFDMLDDGTDHLLLALGPDGLATWNGLELTSFTPAEGVPPGEVLCLHRDEQGIVWIGTNGNGLLRFKNNRVARLSTADGLPDDHIYGIASDGNGRLWLSSRFGVFTIPRKMLNDVADVRNQRLEAKSFSAIDGVPGEPVRAFPPSATKDSEGNVWFPALQGLLKVHSNLLTGLNRPHRLAIEDVRANGVSIIEQRLTPALKYETSFDVAARRTSEVRITYRLDGYDKPGVWRDLHDERTAIFNQIPAGNYRFVARLTTKNSNDVAASSSYRFALPMPWHSTWLARAALALVVLGMLLTLHLTRLAQVQKMNGALLAERSRIARDIHDTLEQDLAGLRLRLEAAGLCLDHSAAKAREHLEAASQLLVDGAVDLRASIRGLQSTSMSGQELLAALRWRLEKLTRGTKFNLTMEVNGEHSTISPSSTAQIVHIIREAVTNVIKHSTAQSITVRVDLADLTAARITVVDDGVDAVANATNPGFWGGNGIKTMRHRAAAIGATLSIEKTPDAGTAVILIIPTGRATAPLSST